MIYFPYGDIQINKHITTRGQFITVDNNLCVIIGRFCIPLRTLDTTIDLLKTIHLVGNGLFTD